jgi:hypothetical protein
MLVAQITDTHILAKGKLYHVKVAVLHRKAPN